MFPHGKKQAEKYVSSLIHEISEEDEELGVSRAIATEGKNPEIDEHRQKKRPAEELRFEVHSIFEKIEDDVTKSLLAKKERMERHLKEFFEGSDQKFKDGWKEQHSDIQKINKEYSRKFATLFEKWGLELQKSKELQEKLNNDFHLEEKVFQQRRATQKKRLKIINVAEEKFLESSEKMEKNAIKLFVNTQKELEEEMIMLQNKVVSESVNHVSEEIMNFIQSSQTIDQQKDLTNIRKTLHSLL